MLTLEIQSFEERETIRRNRLHMILWSFEIMSHSTGHCVSRILRLLLRGLPSDSEFNQLRQTLGSLGPFEM